MQSLPVKTHLCILLVDPDPDDYLLTRQLLDETRHCRCELKWAKNYDEGLALLCSQAPAFDVCLMDVRLGMKTGLMLLEELKEKDFDLPVIMLTGVENSELDMAAMRAGAADYLVKGRFDAQSLEHSIRYAISHNGLLLELRRNAGELAKKNDDLLAAHEELASKNNELLRLNEEKNRLLGMAAHDLRNPLQVIKGYSEFLLDLRGAFLQRSDADMIEKIRSSANFMLLLLNDLLSLSAIESGELQLHRTLADIGEIVRLNIELNRILASRKHMNVHFECDPGLPKIEVDVPKIEQVLNNLLSNSIHYAPPGSSIFVSVRLEGPELIIAVNDEGPGIAPEDTEKLFKPFGRTKNRSTGGEKSTGLGLAIARRIVEGHGGRIWVESQKGLGSTFYVAFSAQSS